jgi:hypothetical protein
MTVLLQTWDSFYANHSVIRTLVAFVHVGASIAGGASLALWFLTTLGGVALPNIG